MTQFALPPPWRNPKSLSPECEQMFVQSSQLFMMSLLLKSCHHHRVSANFIGCGKYLPSTNYSSAKRPRSNSLLGKQRVEMGNKWAVCIWQRLRGATDGKNAAQSTDMYLWKRSLRSLKDTSLWQLSPDIPLSPAHRLNPQGQQPG